LTKSIEVLHAQLAPNGLLAFAIPIGKTFNELNELHRHQFYSEDEVRQQLTGCSLTIVTTVNKVYVASFDNQADALRSIKRVGANFIPNSKPIEGLHKREFFKCKDSISLTYHIGFFIARKS
jgi:malonyl-CoA O-methyltransferase